MLFGALAVLLTGQISPAHAVQAINFDVLLFLFCMFVIGQALEESGYLSHLSYKLFSKARSTDQLVLLILFGIGIASAFLMNDTLAIIGVPVVVLLARKYNMLSKPLLLALAFAVTTGSAMSPIGNPQNLLIALNGNITNPFVTFFGYLLIPTLISLFLTYLVLKFFYRDQFHKNALNHAKEPIKNERLARLSRISLILLALLIALKIGAVFLGIDFPLMYIALIAALPILMLSRKRLDIVRKVDWYTLIFFASMFVLMESVWDTGFFQSIITGLRFDIMSVFAILVISILLSQLISNVPLVALYLPMLVHAGASTKALVALAAGSTIAGNLFILGAASNVIIIQNAEKKYGETITFTEFAKIGMPLIVMNVIVYWVFLSVI